MKIDWIISVEAVVWPDEGEPTLIKQKHMLNHFEQDFIIDHDGDANHMLNLVVTPLVDNVKAAIEETR